MHPERNALWLVLNASQKLKEIKYKMVNVKKVKNLTYKISKLLQITTKNTLHYVLVKFNN